MKKSVVVLAAFLLLLLSLSGCRTIFGRGHGPVETFGFFPENNPELTAPAVGSIREAGDPKQISVVVPPGTDLTRLVATVSLNTEATVTVISSGTRIVQQNGTTPNDFSSPVLYSIEVKGDDQPWQYRVSVREADTNPRLAQLTVEGGTSLSPPFNPAGGSFSVEVPYAAQEVTVAARAESPHLEKISVGQATIRGTSGRTTIPFSGVDRRAVSVVATAEDGASTISYTLILNRAEPDRNSNLDSLEVAGASMVPPFSTDRRNYVATVPFSTESVRVSAIPQSQYATVALETVEGGGGSAGRSPLSYQGSPASDDGARVPFTQADRLLILASVTAQDGTVTTYQLDVRRAEPNRNAALEELRIDGTTLSPGFSPNRLFYTAELPYSTRSFTLHARPQSSLSGLRVERLPAAASGQGIQGNPAAGQGARVSFQDADRIQVVVTVTAEDGTSLRYTVDVRRGTPDSNAMLNRLSVSPGTLQPSFSPRTASYSVSLPASAASVQINASSASRLATISVGAGDAGQSGKPAADQTIVVPVPAGQTVTTTLLVTAQNGSQRAYRISVTRAPQAVQKDDNSRLSNLVVGGATLTPAFSPGRLAYDATLPIRNNSISLYAIAESQAARIFMDGEAVGSSAREFSVKPGQTRIIVIEVVADSGSTTRYTVAANREVPAAQEAPGEQQQPVPQPDSHTQPPHDSDIKDPEQSQTETRPPADIAMRLHVKADSLRLERREASAITDSDTRIDTTGTVTVRAYRSDRVLASGSVRVDARQRGKSAPEISLAWESPAVRTTENAMVEVEVAIPTSSGQYLHYTQAVPAEQEINMAIPFFLLSSNPRVQWPAIGSTVSVSGYVSILPPGLQEKQRAIEGDFQRNNRGEYAVELTVTQPDGGKTLFHGSVSGHGVGRGQKSGFDRELRLAEGQTVSYRLSVAGKNGQRWESTGTTTVWTTHLAYNGGFEPALLFVADQYSR